MRASFYRHARGGAILANALEDLHIDAHVAAASVSFVSSQRSTSDIR
jgi:hypothetical protein